MKSLFDYIGRILKGFSKNPCVYLGVISIILFCLTCFGSNLFIKSLSHNGDFSLATLSKVLGSEENKELCVDSAKNLSPESPDFILIGDCSLKSATPPTTFSPEVLGALVGGYTPEDTKKVITEYIVEEGDSLSSISDKFSISLNTLLWANDLTKNSLIKAGQKLIILPVSGTIHHVKSGDTISAIAQKYKGKTDEIITFNNLSNEADIFIGDIIIIPNGTMPVSTTQYATIWVPLADSYFICPISSPCRITQRLHFYNAIDFSHGNCGESIFAAAGGTVLKVKITSSASRWAFGGAGNTISILHPNGVVTSYGHVAVSLVSVGEQVSQGQIIAFMGGMPGTPGAGLSTGCHLHFGVSGARNPFSK